MTSKEALEYLFGLALFSADNEEHKKCREANKIIKKYLEVLEILKKNHIQTQQLVFVNTPMKTILTFQANDEELIKIEEWLDEK